VHRQVFVSPERQLGLWRYQVVYRNILVYILENVFFSLIVFGGTDVPIVFIFSSAAPQRTAYRQVPSQMRSAIPGEMPSHGKCHPKGSDIPEEMFQV
jgi:hypothetical protein